MVDLGKRQFLKQGLSRLSACGVGAVWTSALLVGCASPKKFNASATDNFALLAADDNGEIGRASGRERVLRLV